ncbi:hypothetical protein AKO1_010316 [Acrasis kona]|uniref:Uncharacterized protein n=1 Tax=Acrasis kona TaxID=1008807 RepID=A0AAW2ZQ73_9EUKA
MTKGAPDGSLYEQQELPSGLGASILQQHQQEYPPQNPQTFADNSSSNFLSQPVVNYNFDLAQPAYNPYLAYGTAPEQTIYNPPPPISYNADTVVQPTDVTFQKHDPPPLQTTYSPTFDSGSPDSTRPFQHKVEVKEFQVDLKPFKKPLLATCIIFLVFAVIFFAVWIGLFFGLNYSEIVVHETYERSICSAEGNSIGQYTCCTKTCSYCSSCSIGSMSCNSAYSSLAQNTSSSCCDGYNCCSTCCSTCTSCSGKSCRTYSCNCYCCASVSNRLCNVRCDSCWRPTINVNVKLLDGREVASTMNNECGRDYSCVNRYLNTYSNGTNFACVYNPQDPKQFQPGLGEYTPWKFAVMYVFAGLTIVTVALWMLSGALCGVATLKN